MRKMTSAENLRKRIRLLVLFFIVALCVSGVTAIPLQWELGILNLLFVDPGSPLSNISPDFGFWIAQVNNGLQHTYAAYPFIAYGTDWLAFGHFVIAIAFLGALRDPVKNIWVVEFGMIACGLILPMALVFGEIRGIPFFWQLIDMSFGVLGFIPLLICRNSILQLAQIEFGISDKSRMLIEERKAQKVIVRDELEYN